uniref:ALMS motif domain-containing protein n=2 Tax=Gasterosteus aculeatus aculeatus TaxID=481459 RepID=A0AAQ4RK39_GASAC
MCVGFHSWTFPNPPTANINEASSKDVTASLHRNVLSWGVWRGKEENESVSLRAIIHSASSQAADSGSRSTKNAASVPDMVGRRPKSTFTSITITVQRTSPSLCNPQDLVYPSTATRPVKKSTPPKPQETPGGKASSLPTSTARVSNSQPDACRRDPAIAMPNEFGRAYSPAREFAGRHGQGTKTGHLVQSRLGRTEIVKKQDGRGGSSINPSSQPLYRSCIQLEVPLRSITSVLFLDKSLYIPLVELEGRRAAQTTLYRCTLSIRFDVSSCRRTSNKRAQINAGYGGPRGALSGRGESDVRETGSGCRRGPPSTHRARKVQRTAPKCDVKGKPGDSDARGHCSTSGLLSFIGPIRSNTNGCRQKENADEAAFALRSNSSQRQRTSNCGPVNFRTWTKPAGSDKTEERQERERSSQSQKVSDKEHLSRLNTDSLEGTLKNLSLKEALELRRPDFISRSQGRVRRLERRARRRRYLQDSDPDLTVQGLGEGRGKQNRNCTTPDPLSDNLFKPRERTISGKEMQLRSRRIYNQLPEVTKKKEEEKKRVVSQTNRLRADVYKKRLLDQILQR